MQPRLSTATLLVLIASAVVSFPAAAQSLQWTSLRGPEGGACRDLAVGEDGRSALVAWTYGLFRTSDAGNSWEPSNTGIPVTTVPRVGATRVAFGSSGLAYAIGLELLRSTDAGNSWQRSPSPPGGLNAILSPMRFPGTVLLVGDGKLYRSSDTGRTWQGPAIPQGDDLSLAEDRATGRVYAGSRGFVYRSDDGGVTWNKIADTTCAGRLPRLAAQENMVVAAGADRGISVSTDAGDTWRSLGEGTLAAGATIATISMDAHIVAIDRQGGIYLSVDSGATFSRVSPGFGPQWCSALGVFSDGTVVAASSRAGVLRSFDDGRTWASANSGLTGVRVLASQILAGGDLIAASETGLFRYIADKEQWTDALAERRPSAYSTSVTATANGTFVAGTVEGFIVSGDRGYTWVLRRYPSTFFRNTQSILQVGPSHLIATTNNGILSSTDGGDSWIPAGLTGLWLSRAVAGPRTIAVGTDYGSDAAVDFGFYRSTDAGYSWDRAGEGLPNSRVRDVFFSASGTLFAATSRGLFHSTDQGASFDVVLRPNGDSSFVSVTGISNGALAAATPRAVYLSPDDGRTWNRDSVQFPEFILSMASDSSGDLVVCTDGAGIFRSRIPSGVLNPTEQSRRDVLCFPNPVTDRFSVRIPVARWTAVRVLDIFGRTMAYEESPGMGSGRLSLDAARWPEGLYVIEVIADPGIRITTSVLVCHAPSR